ncbi:hypothetical protein BCR44DRAFT_1464103 [Catenaria anguillulae PL171]|uniref:Nucleoside diphosphate kinase n=1 Tax=Catenaria anguillulae PL171 TaxID=765915 RepID=A0A1Y2HAV4_9FUNG|nr:hypothetical protein BCR44DRAFT_1464103 [Catenaria anguillulae PL171]
MQPASRALKITIKSMTSRSNLGSRQLSGGRSSSAASTASEKLAAGMARMSLDSPGNNRDTSLPLQPNLKGSVTTPSEERFAFVCDYADPHAQLIREYILFFYPEDNSVEMFDTKQRRTFLRRTKLASLPLSDLILGTTVSVFSRQLVLRDYADAYTRQRMGTAVHHLHLLVPEPHMNQLGDILASFWAGAAIVHDLRMVTRANRPKNGVPAQIADAGEKSAVAHIVAVGTEHVLRATTSDSMGGAAVPPADLLGELAKVKQKWPLVQRIEESLFNAAFAMERPEGSGVRPEDGKGGANKTLMVIRPHAVLDGTFQCNVGPILRDLQGSGLQLRDIQTFILMRPDAEDFLEIYKGVLPEYNRMVDELTSGPLVAIELGAPSGVNALAQVIRPYSFRAKYGKSKVKNAVHCTDLAEDAELETQFFFRILV